MATYVIVWDSYFKMKDQICLINACFVDLDENFNHLSSVI